MCDLTEDETRSFAGFLAKWDPDGTRADLSKDGTWIGTLRLVHDWFRPGSRSPQRAWVVDWRPEDGKGLGNQTLIELNGEPARDENQKRKLSESACTHASKPPEPKPAAFGAPSTDLISNEGLRDRIEAISHALQQAEHRLDEAARIDEEWGGRRVLTALTETLAWLRALDDVLTYTWKREIHPAVRESASRDIDAAIARRTEIPSFVREALVERGRSGEPYADWPLLLLDRALAVSPEQLQGLRWLAGKMLHFGPLPAVALQQARAGSPPHWTWRAASEIFPDVAKDRRRDQRRAYEATLSGMPMMQTFRLTMMLIEMEHLFFGMVRRSNELSESSA